MTQQHIDDETLDLFVRVSSLDDQLSTGADIMAEANYEAVLDHLADCDTCRDQVSIISTLQNEWSQLPYRSSLTEQQQQLICDYIDGVLPAEQAETAQSLIDDQPDAKKAALHYQNHADAMQAQLSKQTEVSAETEVKQSTKNAFIAELLFSFNQLFSFRLPVVYTMTATAALFIAVFLIAQSPEVQPGRMLIASYQDNPTIQFTAKNKLPGVGFFAQPTNTSKPFEDIRIELVSDNTIRISWPEVDGAELYKMRIQVFNQGKKTVLKERTTQTNHTTFLLEPESQTANPQGKSLTSESGKRYEWVLFGNTTDDRVFYASGGFIISRIDNEAEDIESDDSW